MVNIPPGSIITLHRRKSDWHATLVSRGCQGNADAATAEEAMAAVVEAWEAERRKKAGVVVAGESLCGPVAASSDGFTGD